MAKTLTILRHRTRNKSHSVTHWLRSVGALSLLLLALRPSPSQAAILVADYRFEDTLKSSIADAPDLVLEGATSASFITVNLLGSNRTVLELPPGAGLRLDTTGLVGSNQYTAVVFLAPKSTDAYSRVLDVRDPTDSQGWLNLNGQMIFPPTTSVGPVVLQPEQFIQLTLLKAGDTVRAYADGVRQFELSDPDQHAQIGANGLVHFFRQADGNYAPGERVARIRLYSGALTDAEVAALTPVAPVASAPASGAQVVADYRFESSLKSSVSGAPDLTVVGANNFSFVSDTVLGTNRMVLEFPGSSGVRLDASSLVAAGRLHRDRYTMVALFEFNDVGLSRILDARDSPDSYGLFFNTGKLWVNNYPIAQSPSVVARKYVQIALVDDGQYIRIYQDGVKSIDRIDAQDIAAIGSKDLLYFFRQSDGGYGPGGRAARIRLFDGALTDAEVAALIPLVATTPVPPSGAAVVADYRFENSLKSSVAGAPDLTVAGTGNFSFDSDFVLGTNRTVLTFGASSGVRLDASSLIAADRLHRDRYTMVALFELADVNASRILDARDTADGYGLFFNTGKLWVNNYPPALPPGVPAQHYVQITLVDDGQFVRVYQDGVKSLDLIDTQDLVAIGSKNLLYFFRQSDGGYGPGGRVARIRLYDGALTDAEVAALTPLVAPTPVPPSGAQVVADYRFESNLKSSVPGAPDLTMEAQSFSSFVADPIGGTNRTVLEFPPSGGLRLDATGLFNRDHYTMVALFELSDVSTSRILDARDTADALGLFFNGGRLWVNNYPPALLPRVSAHQYVQIAFVDDGHFVRGYVDGVKSLSLVDIQDIAAIGTKNLLYFFRQSDGGYGSGGRVARIRLYDGALTDAEIASLTPLVPPTPVQPKASQLVADYQFHDTFNSSIAGAPPIEPTALDQVSFVDAPELGGRRVLKFNASSGLKLGTTGLIDPDHYTMVIGLAFDSISSYQRLLDPKVPTITAGWFILDGKLIYHPLLSATEPALSTGEFGELTLVNDGSQVRGYIGREKQFELLDSNHYATIGQNGIVSFFRNSDGGYSPGGRVTRIRIYQGALNDADLALLVPSVPGPDLTSIAAGANVALAFNGGYLSVPNTQEVRAPFTVEFWALPNAGGNLGVLGSRQPVDGSFDIKFSGTGGLHADIGTGKGWLTTSADYTFPQAITEWVHVAYIVRADSYEIVVNGQSVATGTYSGDLPLLYDATHQLRIGDTGIGELMRGQLDEVRIWSLARTRAQVAADYKLSLQGDEPGLLQYYRFSEGFGRRPGDLAAASGASTARMIGAGTTLRWVATGPQLDVVDPTGQPSAGLVGLWNFDDASDLGTDSSPQHFQLASLGKATASGIGFSGGGLLLDGTSGFLQGTIFPPAIPVGNAPYSVTAWIKPTGTGTRGIVGWGDYATERAITALRLPGVNGISHAWRSADLTTVSPAIVLGDGDWHHVAATYDGQVRTLWLDGKLLGSDHPGVHAATADRFTLGKTSSNEYYSGLLDEVRLYNRALDPLTVGRLAARQAAPRPDITVSGVSATSDAIMGQAIPVSFTLSNPGIGSAFGPWLNQIVLATDGDGGGAQNLGAIVFSGSITPGASITVTQSVILPAALAGARFLGVRADSENGVAELDESNNAAFATRATTIRGADLSVGGFSSPSSAQFGDVFNVKFDVTNRGTAPASAAWNDRIYLSPSSSSLTGATLLATTAGSPLAAGVGYSRSPSLTLPLITGLPAATYYLIAIADAGSDQAESDEGNNLSARALAISYAPLPDLAIANLTAPLLLTPGTPATIVWAVTNRGTRSVTGEWNEVVAITNTSGGTLSLAEIHSTNTLAVGQSLSRTQAVSIPAWLAQGDWRLTVRADSRLEIFESNEDNNTTAASNLSHVPAQLTLEVSTLESSEGTSLWATVTRNGNRTQPLLVTVIKGDPTEIAATNQVVIPADQASATFAVDAVLDGVVDGPQHVTLGVAAEGYQSGSVNLTVRDIDIPVLQLTLGAPSVKEGLTVAATVTRDYATNLPLVVSLQGFEPAQLLVPASVTIPANALSHTFTLIAVDDDIIEPPRTHSVLATAPGYQSATANVIVLDNDLPDVSLVLANHSASEGAGAQATTATITRNRVSTHALTLEVTSSNEALVSVPRVVRIPAGTDTVTFPVAVIDNRLVESTRTVTLRVFVHDTFDQVIAEGIPDVLQVLDDDGPTLKIAINRDAVPEGQSLAALATITRNTATNESLTVSLSSSLTGELTLPASAVIPKGTSSIAVPLASQLDGLTDGNKIVTVTASANGFTPGSAQIVVTDIDLPDFVVRNVSTPTNGSTGGNFTLRYRIENRGVAPSTFPFLTRISLSTDAIPSDDDSPLGEYLFEGTIPVGQFIEQTVQFPLPNKAGRSWVILITDAADQTPEVLENNNTFISPLPIEVSPAYRAVAQVDVDKALAGTPIVLRGQAFRTFSPTAVPAGVPMNFYVVTRGTVRTIPVETDAQGRFGTVWQPLAGEAGFYEVSAGPVGDTVPPAQDSFTLLGIRANPGSVALRLPEQSSVTGEIRLENLSALPLTQLSVAILDPSPALNLTAELSDLGNLPGSGFIRLAYVVTALQSPNQKAGTVRLKVSNPDGIALEIPLYITIEPHRPRLVALPTEIQRSVVRGRQTFVEFDVLNDGGTPSGPLQVSLPQLAWLTLVSTNPAPSLAPGETNRITLAMTPPADASLTEFLGNLAINGTNSSLAVPLSLRTVSTAVADLRVIAEDEFTYFAEGAPRVTNAIITLTETVSRAVIITNAPVDTHGELLIHGLTEGYYDLEVQAGQHQMSRQTLLIKADQTNEVRAFISRELVTYTWTVTPVKTEDHYRITIETTFEANVPAPVVTLSPTSVDIGALEFVRGVAQINFTLENHGLIAAQAAQLRLPDNEDYEFRALVTDLGMIPAHAKLIVPVQVLRKHGIIETLTGPVIASGTGQLVTSAPTPNPVPVPPPIDRGLLITNQPATGTLANAQAILYRVEISGNQTLEVTLTSGATSGTNTMYVRFGQPPTETEFDQVTRNATTPNARLAIPAEQEGTYYILVHASNMPAATTAYTLSAKLLPFSVTSTSTRILGNSGLVTFRIAGAGFDPSTRIALIGHGETNYPSNLWIKDTASIGVTFDLRGKALGAYDLDVYNVTSLSTTLPDGSSGTEDVIVSEIRLPGYLQVVQGSPVALSVKVSVPEKVQLVREFSFQIVITNPGTSDFPSPLLRVSGRNHTQFNPLIDPSDVASESVVQIVGQLHRSSLAPGETIVLDYIGSVTSGVDARIEVEDLSQVSGPIHWDEFAAFYQRRVETPNWTQTWAAFQQRAGNTLSSLHEAMKGAVRHFPAGLGAEIISADALILRLFESPGSAPLPASTPEPAQLASNATRPARSLQLQSTQDILLLLKQKAKACYQIRADDNYFGAELPIQLDLMRAAKKFETPLILGVLINRYGAYYAGLVDAYLSYDFEKIPIIPQRQVFTDSSEVVQGTTSPERIGFKKSAVTVRAVAGLRWPIRNALKNSFKNCTLSCGSLPPSILISNLFNALPDKGVAAYKAFTEEMNFNADIDLDPDLPDLYGIPKNLAGGRSGNFRGTVDKGELDLKKSRVLLKPIRGKCGTLIELGFETDLVIKYQDSFDFCPGALAYFPGQKQVSEHMQRWEAYELAYSVPFTVIYKPEPLKESIAAGQLAGVCPQSCCAGTVAVDYSYECGPHPVAKRAQSSIGNSACKKGAEGAPDCQTAGGGGGELESQEDADGGGGASGGSRTIYAIEIPCSKPGSARAALAASSSPQASGEVCAKVKLRLEQEVVTTRDAFQATLEIGNNTAADLEGVLVNLIVRDRFGGDATELFGIRPPTLDGISGVDGGGILPGNRTGKAGWLLIPTIDAATNGPTVYFVSGTFSYTFNGLRVTVPLAPAPITALPSASLVLKYFHQRDVFSDDPYTTEIEPSIPFALAVLIQNNGKGTAGNLRITSGQPKIVENAKGLLIDFLCIGTQVDGQDVSPSLTASFGNILPGQIAIARWLFTASLQGLFLDYQATFEHLDAIGNKRISLIDHVEIHEMNHIVQAGGSFEEGHPDFLVNDVPDADDLPDTVHFSDGTTSPVQAFTTASIIGSAVGADAVVQLNAVMSRGWGYLRVPEPANGSARLSRVVRSDGVEISLGTNVWTTDRTFIGQGRRPITENRLHLFDYDSPGHYTLHYTTLPPVDHQAPTSLVAALTPHSYAQFPIHWAGTDELGGSGVSTFDIYVSIDGGPFDPWLRRTLLTSSVYPGQTGHTYAFYSLATDQGGNRELPHVVADAQTATILSNAPPTLSLPQIVTINEGENLDLTPSAGDLDADQALTFALLLGAPAGVIIDSNSGHLSWSTGEGNGPSTNQIRISVTDNGLPALSAVADVTVVVNEVNVAPTLAPVTTRTVNELQTLTQAFVAADTDLPKQTLRYSLGAGAPTGARMDVTNGVVTWTPSALDGPSTNHITVTVRDNGTPPLSASQDFTVIVRDSRPDFTVSLSSTNVLAGQSDRIVVTLDTGLDLASVSFLLDLSSDRLQDLTVQPLIPELSNVTLSPDGPMRYRVRLVAATGRVFQGNRAIAGLDFNLGLNPHSEVLYMGLPEITAVRASGEGAPKALGLNGRLVIVGLEPLLLADPGSAVVLQLFGTLGLNYTLEQTPDLNLLQPWLPVLRYQQTTPIHRYPIDTDKPAMLYHLREN